MTAFVIDNRTCAINYMHNLCYNEPIGDLEDPFTKADEIAQMIRDEYGLIVVDAEHYYYQGEFQTIMDILECPYDHAADPVTSWILLRSFKKLDFKYAKDCKSKELHSLMSGFQHPVYQTYTWGNDGQRHISYAYADIKKNNKAMHMDLIRELYNPVRIQKWIMAGNDIENYLT